MHSREGDSQGKANGTSLKDEWEELGLPKCNFHSREKNRAHSFRSKEFSQGGHISSGSRNSLKEGASLQVEGVISRRVHLFGSKECAQRKPKRVSGVSTKDEG